MQHNPHSADRIIAIGCNPLAGEHCLVLYLSDVPVDEWPEQTDLFLSETVRYDTTTLAIFVAPDLYSEPHTQEVLARVRMHYAHARINQNSVEANGSEQGRNFLRNCARIAEKQAHVSPVHDAVRALTPALEGRTVFVAGAGPSLDQSLEALRSSGCPILAVNTSGGAFASAGIKPTAIVVMESKSIVEGITLCDDDVPVVFDMSAHPANWIGARTKLAYVGGEPNFATYASELGLLPIAYGSSCTTAAVSLALACGATRVCLVGQDCAFEPLSTWALATSTVNTYRMYAKGTPYEATIARDTCATPEGDARRVFEVNKPTVGRVTQDAFCVTSVTGGTVYTTHVMASVAMWFAALPAHVRSRIVNCSAGGMLIDGLEHGDARDYGESLDVHRVRRLALDPKAAGQLFERALRVAHGAASTALDVLSLGGDDVAVLEAARHFAIVNMWTAPEKLRMKREELVLPAGARGRRIAEVVRQACREIVALSQEGAG